MRYRGQAYELTVPLRAGSLAGAERAFRTAHRRAYGYGSPVDETEIVTLRVRGSRRVLRTPLESPRDVPSARSRGGQRLVAGRSYRIFERDGLGGSLRGPAIVEQEDSTIVVGTGWQLTRGRGESLVLER
jgi:N-methylhydantoinase A